MNRIGMGIITISIGIASTTPAWGQCSPQQLAKLIASDAAQNDYFGQSVAVSGDTAVVGVYLEDNAGGVDAGSAYVFARTGGVWVQQAKLMASDAAVNDNFGVLVTVFGDTAVIGAPGDDHAGGTNAGSAYVFVRTGTVWTQQAKLIASDAASLEYFGSSNVVLGDTAIVGAIFDNGMGAAYVFVRSGGVWTQQAKLIASDAASGDQFGSSVAISGDTAVVGALTDDIGGATNAGSAYVFVRTGTTWSQQARLSASDAGNSDQLGISVAVSVNTALVEANNDTHSVGVNAGSAYVFVRSGINWTQQTKLTASDGAASDKFGQSVALAGDTCGSWIARQYQLRWHKRGLNLRLQPHGHFMDPTGQTDCLRCRCS